MCGKHHVMMGIFTDNLYYVAGLIFKAELQNVKQPEKPCKGGDLHNSKVVVPC
jgi:hypothetical protein